MVSKGKSTVNDELRSGRKRECNAQTIEPGYNNISLYDTSPTESHILWYQFIHHC